MGKPLGSQGRDDENVTSSDCIRTLPRGGMYWEIYPPRPKRFPEGGEFAPRGTRDCPRAKPEGNLEDRGPNFPQKW